MLKYFDKYPDVELVPEPVAQWCDVKGHNLLGILTLQTSLVDLNRIQNRSGPDTA